MIAVLSVSQSVSQSVSLSRGLTPFHCAKTVERIRILFKVNTLRGPRNIVLDRSPDPQRGRKSWGKFRPLWTPYTSQEWLKVETLNFAPL